MQPYLFLERSFKNLTKQSDDLYHAPESLLYQNKAKWRKLGAAAALIGGVLLWFKDFPRNVVPYAFCVVLAGLFLFYIYRFISYQVAVARRRPPQMDRKGAVSDEN